MLNRKKQKKIISNPQNNLKNSNTTQLNNSSSFFKVYKDGIGFKNYSVRLSNFSVNNTIANFARLAYWTVSIGSVISIKSFATNVGLASSDERTHYKVSANAIYSALFIRNVFNGKCDVNYDQSRQDEYAGLQCKQIYSIDLYLSSSPNYYTDHRVDRVTLCRGYLQPIYQITENCLKGLVNETAHDWKTTLIEMDLQRKQLHWEYLVNSTPYLLTAAGLVGLFAAGWQINKWHQYRNSPEARLERINYHGEINPDFLCPINKTIMKDPVITNDGHTYDRSAIEGWLNYGHNTSPLIPTIKIIRSQIKPDFELRQRIEDFVAEQEKQYRDNILRRRNGR